MASLTTIARDVQQMKSLLKTNDLVNEKEAAKERGVTPRTMQIQVSSGRIPRDWYTINDLGERNYYLSKIKGL